VIGIENVNEFYTNHYLAAILGSDIRPHLDRWREQAKDGDESTPWRRLAQLQRDWFRHRETMQRIRPAKERVQAHRGITARLLEALGYETKPLHAELGSGPLPLLGTLQRGDGEPLLWLLAAPAGFDDDRDLLARALLPEQHELLSELPPGFEPKKIHEHSVEELVTHAFGQQEPPRFVLILGDGEWILADRGKWAEQRLLRFDLDELLGRRDSDTLQAVVALLHRETLAPASGTSLVDTLDDSSHKHAYAVSEDLKYALQASIEAIGNEAIRYRMQVSKKKVYGEEINAQDLAIECIRYMYRILFLLYIEARPELGYAPMGSEAYRLGYSLERLRDLEMLELDTLEARDGYTIHLSLERLFRMVREGTQQATLAQQSLMAGKGRARRMALDGDDPSIHHTFRLVPLEGRLFDPEHTPFLSKVKLRNSVLLEVVRSMSLSKPQGTGKNKRRGRISYATLGINQLGAVYEALLSFRGIFAEQTLFEVRPAPASKDDIGKPPDPIQEPVFLVPESELHRYKKEERVFDENRNVKAYPPGTFIYRMTGRDRQKSASYYTPEVLTRCLVKYALKELLENEDGSPKHAKAEDLLELTICEPAMGSAAFLNEAINQLAERYLQRRQQELGERIPHERYLHELQRVRMVLADNNVFGVDLNPVAIELAEVSLWLNAIFTQETDQGRRVFVPWFGGQLCCGNSLVGAWRKVFDHKQVDAGKQGKKAPWLDAVPERIPLGTERPKGSVYHFLLPDRGMAVYGQGNEGKPIREMCKDELATIEAWRKEMCQPLDKREREALVRLSDAVDRLWSRHAELLAKVRERTTDPLAVYGYEHPLAGRAPTSTREKDRIWKREMQSEQVRASSPYRRLKLAMDYWCALWFWPIRKADELPDREEWLTDMALLLDADVLPSLEGGQDQRSLFAPTMPADEARSLVSEVGFADVERLIGRWPRLRLADELARRYRFHHWELEFADIFVERGGFDLVLGNPPWIPLRWTEKIVLADAEPLFALRKLAAAHVTDLREGILAHRSFRQTFLGEHEGIEGARGFLTSGQNYPLLGRGIRTNLYKCFLGIVWSCVSSEGYTGLLHPEGIYDDPNGGVLRASAYRRLRRHFQLQNALNLFPIAHRERYSINIYGPVRQAVEFDHIANLFWPATIDDSYNGSASGPVPGIKNRLNNWDFRGHRSRIVRVDKSILGLFAGLYDSPRTPVLHARLPAIHSTVLLNELRSFLGVSQKVGDLGDWQAYAQWHETHAQRDGTIRRDTSFPRSPEGLVVSGPHFHVARPYYKTPREKCTEKGHYSVVDLTDMPVDYLPRTNYVPGCDEAEYRNRSPKLRWGETHPALVSDCYRVISSEAIGPDGERTLQSAIIPPGFAHIHKVYSYAFRDDRQLLRVAASWSSVPLDFFVKTTGTGSFLPNLASQLPVVPEGIGPLNLRVLLLNCLSEHYADLWSDNFEDNYRLDTWSIEDERLDTTHFRQLSEKWRPGTPLRDDYSRRLAMVEIDVLVAMAIGISMRGLQTMYRVQFPVMRHYERDTWYDRNGRIVFTNSKGLVGVGLPRTTSKGDPNPCWNDVQHMAEEAGYTGSDTVTQVVTDDTLPGGPREKTIVYQAPWVRCDRERDYEVAWAHFEERFGRKTP
jgi:hypothetical protein